MGLLMTCWWKLPIFFAQLLGYFPRLRLKFGNKTSQQVTLSTYPKIWAAVTFMTHTTRGTYISCSDIHLNTKCSFWKFPLNLYFVCHQLNWFHRKFNKARTGPRSAARFCKILKLCNKFISIHYHRKYKYMGYPNVGDNCLKLIPTWQWTTSFLWIIV